ncbi:hypothetical protein CEXT_459461 [Caerostris extrusa]|uniref:Uncharacterized protein n=1 Tax=Caerostris extrusa TaxID=172846 RepID=A0AAV4TZV9_CAEEX|nr:hypothetical protein CEXT_459461 [Caerostris extrusa]
MLYFICMALSKIQKQKRYDKFLATNLSEKCLSSRAKATCESLPQIGSPKLFVTFCIRDSGRRWRRIGQSRVICHWQKKNAFFTVASVYFAGMHQQR